VRKPLATGFPRHTPMQAAALSAFIGVYRRLIGFLHSF
jgi:hypothetical protein